MSDHAETVREALKAVTFMVERELAEAEADLARKDKALRYCEEYHQDSDLARAALAEPKDAPERCPNCADSLLNEGRRCYNHDPATAALRAEHTQTQEPTE